MWKGPGLATIQSYIQLLGIQSIKFLPWKYKMENNILNKS